MKPEQITAWALEEMPPEESLRLESELQETPAAWKAAEETRDFCTFLLAELRDESLALTDSQRLRLIAQSAHVKPAAPVVPQVSTATRQPRTWITGVARLALAACVVLGGFGTWSLYESHQRARSLAAAAVPARLQLVLPRVQLALPASKPDTNVRLLADKGIKSVAPVGNDLKLTLTPALPADSPLEQLLPQANDSIGLTKQWSAVVASDSGLFQPWWDRPGGSAAMSQSPVPFSPLTSGTGAALSSSLSNLEVAALAPVDAPLVTDNRPITSAWWLPILGDAAPTLQAPAGPPPSVVTSRLEPRTFAKAEFAPRPQASTSQPPAPPRATTELSKQGVGHDFANPLREPHSSFALNVDTASYAQVRRLLNQGQRPSVEAVRLEELINAFPTAEEAPAANAKVPLAVQVEVAPCPWQTSHKLARIAIQGRESAAERKPKEIIAKDAKVQVEFNPAQVRLYRLLGYEKRGQAKPAANEEAKDVAEMAAGYSLVALYELVPVEQAAPARSGEVLTVKLRYKEPASSVSKLIETTAKDEGKSLAASSPEFKFTAAVAGFGLWLRQPEQVATLSLDALHQLAVEGQGADKLGHRREFLQLIDKSKGLPLKRP